VFSLRNMYVLSHHRAQTVFFAILGGVGPSRVCQLQYTECPLNLFQASRAISKCVRCSLLLKRAPAARLACDECPALRVMPSA
jgi:hypothetical protein